VIVRVKPATHRWTKEEDELLRALALTNAAPFEIATQLKRSISSIKARAFRIGVPLGLLPKNSP
jgi:hypothetical protein